MIDRMAMLGAALALLAAAGPLHAGAAPDARTPGPDRAPAAASADHQIHLSFTRVVFENGALVAQVRMFSDDLTDALRRHHGDATLALAANARVDAIALDYLRSRLRLAVDGRVVEPRIEASGVDDDMWWYVVRYDAPASAASLTIANELLFELFDDQRNIVKVLAPGGRRGEDTLFFVAEDGARTQRLTLGGGRAR